MREFAQKSLATKQCKLTLAYLVFGLVYFVFFMCFFCIWDGIFGILDGQFGICDSVFHTSAGREGGSDNYEL